MLSRRARSAAYAATMVLCVGFGQALGQSGEGPESIGEFDLDAELNRGVEASDANLLGDAIGLESGSLSFRQVDVSLPGNSDLPVEFARTYSVGGVSYFGNQLGGWNLDVPFLTGRQIHRESLYYGLYGNDDPAAGGGWGATPCSGTFQPNAPFPGQSHPAWGGARMFIPGQGGKMLLERVQGSSAVWGTIPKKVTTDHWRVDCLSSLQNSSGEGFIATSPQGVKYTFDYALSFASSRVVMDVDGTYADRVVGDGPQLAATYGEPKEEPETETPPVTTLGLGSPTEPLPPTRVPFTIRNVNIMATRVEDRNGNWVAYDYDGTRLVRIHANDGREITLNWSNGRVSSVSANGRTWSYGHTSYSSVSTQFSHRLSSVTLPDGRAWSFSLPPMIGFQKGNYCWTSTGPDGQETITHPNGVTGTFRFAYIRNGANNVPDHLHQPKAFGEDPRTTCQDYKYETYRTSRAVVEKELSIPGLGGSTTAKWTYAYAQDDGYRDYPDSPASRDLKKRTVTLPDGTRRHSWFNRRFASLFQGMLMKEEVRSGSGALIEARSYTYEDLPPLGDVNLIKLPVEIPPDAMRPLREQTITRGSDWYKTRNTYAKSLSSSSYSFGRPTKTEAWSNTSGDFAGRQITDTTYIHKKDRWILALPNVVKRNGKEFDDYDYDSLGRVTAHKRFDATFATYGYHTDTRFKGALRWKRDGLNRVSGFFDYHRGVPRQVNLPRFDGGTQYRIDRTVDDNGWITSVTDAMRVRTGYGRDSMGRLTAIDRPADLPWNDTTIGYSSLGSGLVRTVTRGARTTRTTYDGMMRPVLTEEVGVSAGASVFTRTAYDGLGRGTFTSKPSTSSGAAAGIYTDYDALGRPTTVRERVSASGTIHATTSYSYPRGDRFTVTDPEGHQTHRFLDAWGDPDAGVLKTITQYQGGSTLLSRTDMTYDIWGNMLTARQHGTSGGYSVDETQRYHYDSRLRLCRHYTPETGSTLYRYDAANQLKEEARGQGGWSESCGNMPTERIIYSYDGLGRLDYVNYVGATPDINYEYDANGNPTLVSRAGAMWNYTYFYLGTEDLLKSETLTLDGRTYRTAYGYSMGGTRTSTLYPTGLSIVHAPDPLGRPQRAQKRNAEFYASNIQYHPNGQIKQLKYANGHWLTQSLNARQLPLERKVSGNGFTVLHQRHNGYYRTGQIKDLDDLRDRSLDRYFAYDGMGRLTSASGPWGTGSYKYDALGNLRQKTLGSATLTSEYMDGTNGTPNKGRLRRYKGTYQDGSTGGAWRTFAYDARGNVLGDGQHSWTYDLSDQPIRMTKPSAGTWADFVYDGNLKRVKQTRSDGSVTYSVYSQDGSLLHRDEVKSGTRTRTDYIRAGGETVARIVNGTPEYVHNDHLGSPVAQTEPDGTVAWRECYTPFGEEWRRGGRCASSEPWDDEIAFTGHVKDKDSGLTYMQARYYDPKVGRFYASDPVAFSPERPDMFNRYAYAANDPVNMVDPDGRKPDHIQDRFNAGVVQATQECDSACAGAVGKLALTVGNDLANPLADVGEFISNPSPGTAAIAAAGALPGPNVVKHAKRFSDEKAALVDMAKQDKRTGGITEGDMEAYKELNAELSDSFPEDAVRGPEAHPGRGHGSQPHGHVGPVDHIPIKPDEPE